MKRTAMLWLMAAGIIMGMGSIVFSRDTGDACNPPPPGFVDLKTVVPGIRLDIKYHTADNFTGAAVPGYAAVGAWLHPKPAAALAKVQKALQKHGYGLVVYDAYRPHRATLAFVAWAKRSGNGHLITQHYIAASSYHNNGIAIDLGLVDLKTGKYPDMGTAFDTLSPKSHTANAEGEVLQRRLLLLDTMKQYGFRNHHTEWWHYSYWVKGTTPRDVPYGRCEAPEGVWKAPEGWDAPGWHPPPPAPCPAENGPGDPLKKNQ